MSGPVKKCRKDMNRNFRRTEFLKTKGHMKKMLRFNGRKENASRNHWGASPHLTSARTAFTQKSEKKFPQGCWGKRGPHPLLAER